MVRAEFGGVVAQRIMPRGHGAIATRLQVSQPQRADDPMADLDHGGDVGIAGRLTREKARREAWSVRSR